MALKSLQIEEVQWNILVLSEQVLLLKAEDESVPIAAVHKACRLLESTQILGLKELVPAYNEIALFYDHLLEDPSQEIEQLQKGVSNLDSMTISPQTHRVPVCYEKGLDWKMVEEYTGIEKSEIMRLHSAGEYVVAMMGFMPGFVFLEGMNASIACPRKEDPRTRIPSGAVGIGGSQTGIYSLESPGGWQIIGRTPHSFFNVSDDPPSQLQPGDKMVFEPISETEFDDLKNKTEAG